MRGLAIWFASGLAVGLMVSSAESFGWSQRHGASICVTTSNDNDFTAESGRVVNTEFSLMNFSCPFIENSTNGMHVAATYVETQIEYPTSGSPFASASACVLANSGALLCGASNSGSSPGNTFPLAPALTYWQDPTYQWWGASLTVGMTRNVAIRSFSVNGS